MVTLAFVGDIMLGRGVCDELARQRPEEFWGSTRSTLGAADGVIGNLEFAITRCQSRWQRTPKVFHFRSDISSVDVLRAGNIRAVTLANNHILDYGEEGLIETLRYLDLADIAHAGAGHSLDEAAAPAVFDAGGLRIGLISLTDNEPPFGATDERPGTNYIEITTEAAALGRVEDAIRRARTEGAEFIVLSPHWGPNMVVKPPQEFRDFAHAAIDMGVDLIHGHSAHIFQGVEVYNDRLIMYDTGDFLDDYAVDPALRNDWSFIFLVEIEDARVRRLRLIPALLTYARVDLAPAPIAKRIVERMQQLCAEFDTPLQRTVEGLEVNLYARSGVRSE